MSKLIHGAISNKVLGAAFAVHKTLGAGLLESAHEGALVVELKHGGIFVERQKVFPLECLWEYIGAYIADIVVENIVIVELESVTKLNEVMEAQLINYLKLSHLPVGYLFNFYNTSLAWRRFVN